jgi:hypothetical protein
MNSIFLFVLFTGRPVVKVLPFSNHQHRKQYHAFIVITKKRFFSKEYNDLLEILYRI